MDCDAPPIDEYTVLWVDRTPQMDEEGNLAVNEKGEVITCLLYTSMSLVGLSGSISTVTGQNSL